MPIPIPSPDHLRVAPELGPLEMLEHAISLLHNTLDAVHAFAPRATGTLEPRVALARSMVPLLTSLSQLAGEYRAVVTDKIYADSHDAPY